MIRVNVRSTWKNLFLSIVKGLKVLLQFLCCIFNKDVSFALVLKYVVSAILETRRSWEKSDEIQKRARYELVIDS